MKTRNLVSMLSMASVLALTGVSCGQNLTAKLTEKATESYVENRIESESNGNVDLDLSDGTMKFEGEDGAKVQYGNNLSIPSDFPKAVPIYAGANVLATTINGNESTATLQSTDSADNILVWYEGQLNGWTRVQSFDSMGYNMRSYTKGNEKLTINVGSSEGNSSITLYYQLDAEVQNK